jgi:hypothetical protein
MTLHERLGQQVGIRTAVRGVDNLTAPEPVG